MPDHQSQNRIQEDGHPDTGANSQVARLNAILNALTDSELKQLWPKLEPVKLSLGDALYEPDQRINYIYFPTEGMISLLALFEDGATVEAGVIGSEGLLGTPIALGAETTPHQAIVQLPGQALRMSASEMKAEMERDGVLLKRMLRYTDVLFTQVAQTAACNRVHSIVQRLSRWLLFRHDRVSGVDLEMTQEFISRMLGVRRAGVSIAASELKHAGLIDYRRGNVIVEDRAGLERLVCECYEIVKREYDRYLQS